MKFLTIFLLIIVLTSILAYFSFHDKDYKVYVVDSDARVYGVCWGFECKGVIKENSTINDINLLNNSVAS